jgi:uncharacterized protein (TIGR03435 family)
MMVAAPQAAQLAQARLTPPAPGAKVQIRFEVASIRPAAPMPSAPAAAGGPDVPPPPGLKEAGCIAGFSMDGDRVSRRCVSLKELLLLDVFAIDPSRLLGPDWMADRRFDISAKLPEGTTPDQLPEMFQALLEDRFGLAFHREYKEQSVYALVLSKSGLKLKPAAVDSSPPPWVVPADADKSPTFGISNGIRFRVVSQYAGPDGGPIVIMQTPKMGFVRNSNGSGLKFVRRWEAPSITSDGIADLATMAGAAPNVIDMTGLKGRYQVDLIVPFDLTALINGPGPRGPGALQNALFGAVQDELKKHGLQLERRQGPVETIVIDRLEKTPTEN